MRSRLALMTLWLAGYAAGCARAPKELPPPVPVESSEIASLLSRLDGESEAIRRYRGLVRVRGRGPEGGFDAKLVILFERPHELRVELLGALGGTRWSAVANENGITAYFPGRRQYVREDEAEEVVSLLLGLGLSSEQVMAALSGVGVPFDGSTAAEGYRRGSALFLELQGEPGDRSLQLDERGQVVTARTGTYRVSYPTSWKERRQIPDRVVLENETIEARLETEDVDVNVPLDPEAFLLAIPDDAVRLRPAEVAGEAVFVIEKEPGAPRSR